MRRIPTRPMCSVFFFSTVKKIGKEHTTHIPFCFSRHLGGVSTLNPIGRKERILHFQNVMI